MQDRQVFLQKRQRNMKVLLQSAKGKKPVDVTRLMAVMGLCVKCGQDVRVEIDGADEEAAFEGMKAFFEENL